MNKRVRSLTRLFFTETELNSYITTKGELIFDTSFEFVTLEWLDDMIPYHIDCYEYFDDALGIWVDI